MYELFDNLIEIYGLTGDKTSEQWFDMYYEDGCDLLDKFDEEDWMELKEELPNKSNPWKECMVFCFGDNNNQHENYNSILRLNLNSNNAWEVLFVKENDTFLARNSSVSFIFENSDMVYICGGKDNNDNDTEYIVEFDISKRNVKKSQLTLKKTACFDIEECVDLNKMHFAFFDNNDFVQTISRNFKMSIIKSETIVPRQGIMSN